MTITTVTCQGRPDLWNSRGAEAGEGRRCRYAGTRDAARVFWHKGCGADVGEDRTSAQGVGAGQDLCIYLG